MHHSVGYGCDFQRRAEGITKATGAVHCLPTVSGTNLHALLLLQVSRLGPSELSAITLGSTYFNLVGLSM